MKRSQSYTSLFVAAIVHLHPYGHPEIKTLPNRLIGTVYIFLFIRLCSQETDHGILKYLDPFKKDHWQLTKFFP